MTIPSVRHMHDPRIQHQVTEAGPPNNSGVLNVVATLEQSPMMLKAKLIFGDEFSNDHDHWLFQAYCRQARKFALEGGFVAHFVQKNVIIRFVRAR